MVKADIIDKVHYKTGVPKAIVSTVFEAVTAEIISAVSDDENVIIRGFGTFKPKRVSARKGRDFSGNSVQIPERMVPAFSPSDLFRKLMEDKADVKD